MVWDSGHEMDKIGMGSGGTGASMVNSVSEIGQCSKVRRSSWKCGGRGCASGFKSRRGIEESVRK